MKITPDTVTSARKVAKPCTVAAALCACAPASTTRITGRPSNAAVSAVEPVAFPGAVCAPSNRPMTPSPMTISAPVAACANRAETV